MIEISMNKADINDSQPQQASEHNSLAALFRIIQS